MGYPRLQEVINSGGGAVALFFRSDLFQLTPQRLKNPAMLPVFFLYGFPAGPSHRRAPSDRLRDHEKTHSRLAAIRRLSRARSRGRGEAEFYLELKDLTRDAAATRSGGAIAQKSQMRAFIVKPEDKTRVIAWTETETYEQHTEFSIGAPNEVNLTHHFVNALQVARGEKRSSIRDLCKQPKQPKP